MHGAPQEIYGSRSSTRSHTRRDHSNGPPVRRNRGPNVTRVLPRLGLALMVGLALVAAAPNGSRAAASVPNTSRAAATAPNTWSASGNMVTSRTVHTATLLPDGQVLVAGGYDPSFHTLSSAELYNPATGTWTQTGAMSTARQGHTATLLSDGKVLVAGGNGPSGNLSGAELYDPATGTWTTTGAMGAARAFHTATVLDNGDVLVAGGLNSSGTAFAGAELYDPATGTWTAIGSMAAARAFHTATLLPDGRILVAGGAQGTNFYSMIAGAEIYDPSSGTWTPTGSMTAGRAAHTATLLPSGQVLVAGGCQPYLNAGLSCLSYPLSSAELYNPTTGAWTSTGGMTAARGLYAETLLPDGTVLAAGGSGAPTDLSSAEIYNPGTGAWTATGAMTAPRANLAMTLLPSGLVLATGGQSCCGSQQTADLYTPAAGPLATISPAALTFSAQLLGTTSKPLTVTVTNTGSAPLTVTSVTTSDSAFAVRTRCTAGPVAAGASCTIGVRFTPASPGNAGATLSIVDNAPTSPQSVTLTAYGTAGNPWAQTGALNANRFAHTATLLPNGMVLAAGGEDNSDDDTGCAYNASADLYNPGGGTWLATGAMTTQRADHTATLLPDGRVLVAGGVQGSFCTAALASAEVYDPSTGSWSATASMAAARYGHTATLLPSGQVLVTGGIGATSNPIYSGSPISSTELYDPRTSTWKTTASMHAARVGHTATLLPNGTVLVAGGGTATAELYNPRTNAWTPTGSMTTGRSFHTATLLRNGLVLVAGGVDGSGHCLTSAELYNPSTGTWTAIAPMPTAHAGHTATLLPDARVLVAGGYSSLIGNAVNNVEVYDPRTGVWTATDPMISGRANHTATLLPSGSVLVAGGSTGANCCGITAAELYTPTVLAANPTSGTVGQTVTLTGTRYVAGQTVKVYWDSTSTPPLATVKVGKSGSFVTTMTVPGTSSGSHVILAAATTGTPWDSAGFVVKP